MAEQQAENLKVVGSTPILGMRLDACAKDGQVSAKSEAYNTCRGGPAGLTPTAAAGSWPRCLAGV